MCEAPINLFPSLFFSPVSFVRLSNAHLPDKMRQRKNTVFAHGTYNVYYVPCFPNRKRRSQDNKKTRITHMRVRSLLQ